MKLDFARAILTDIKFVRSPKDVRILIEKFPFSFRRITGRFANESKVPPSLQIEPTNSCNANCICCPRENMQRKKGYMEFPLFCKIIDDAANCGVKRVHLYLHGEPFLHPHILEMITYLKRAGLSLTLSTNGMLLTEELGEAVLRCGVDLGDYIIFSILGNSASVHEEIMRGINHDTVLKNVTGLLKSRKKLRVNGPIIQAIFYQMRENEAETLLFQREWQHRVDRAYVAGKISKSFANSKSDESKILVRTQTCSNIWERMTVHWTGDVVQCCGDINAEHIIGDLHNQSIKELWNSGGLSNIRKLHRERGFCEIESCAKCDI